MPRLTRLPGTTVTGVTTPGHAVSHGRSLNETPRVSDDSARSDSAPPLGHLALRILVTVVAVLFFLQAVFAGQFLSGTFGSLLMHQNNAALTDMVLFVTVPAAVLLRWPGRGPFWPILAVLGLIVLSYTESSLGSSRIITLHIPLGVAIILLSTGLAIWAWRASPVSWSRRRARRDRASSDSSDHG